MSAATAGSGICIGTVIGPVEASRGGPRHLEAWLTLSHGGRLILSTRWVFDARPYATIMEARFVTEPELRAFLRSVGLIPARNLLGWVNHQVRKDLDARTRAILSKAFRNWSDDDKAYVRANLPTTQRV